MAELKKESWAVQCTETNCHSGLDVLDTIAGLIDHHILPEEVHILYGEVTDLVQKSRVKDEYIEELNLKLRQLENENKDLKQTVYIFRQETGNIRSRGSSGCDHLDRDDRVNRDIIQSLLLKLVNLGNENKELREMYQRVVEKNDMMEGIAQQCARLQELNSQLQKETEKLRWVETLYSQKEKELEYSQKKLQKLQQVHNILRGNIHKSIITSQSPLKEEDQLPDQIQAFRPFKRGRFVMDKSCSYECSKCFKFFPTKEVSEESPCCYHLQKPVKAILRPEDGTVDPQHLAAEDDVQVPTAEKNGNDHSHSDYDLDLYLDCVAENATDL